MPPRQIVFSTSVSSSTDFLGDLPNSLSISRQKKDPETTENLQKTLNPRKMLFCVGGHSLFLIWLMAVVCGILGIF